jgi:ABC-type branched-subunit amino acid transport system ATPase component/ABC-type branched-subunit amino acid transport system permease subunit
MTGFVELLILGMTTGSFYTINALGMVVVFRSSGIVNFAAGGAAMMGGYIWWDVSANLGWPQWLSLVSGIAVAAAVNLLTYLLAVRPMGGASTLTKVIATLAVLVSLQQIVLLAFGGTLRVPRSLLPTRTVRIDGISVGLDSIIFVIFTVILTFALWAVYRYTRFGLSTSALSENPTALASLGWRISRLRAANWAIGGALAGIAGVGLAPFLNLNVENFTLLLTPTLAAAVLGGLRSFPLTLVGGLFVGAAEDVAGRYISWPGASDAVSFFIIILVLMLNGQRIPLRSFVQERLPRVGSGRLRPSRIVIAVLVTVVVAQFVSTNWVIGATTMLILSILLLSQVVITGYAGQLSLAQLTISGVGALVAVRVTSAVGIPFILALPIGMLCTIPVSILLGLPSLRARGVSLAITTLGFAYVVNSTVLTNSRLTGGVLGYTVAPPTLFGLHIDQISHPTAYFYVTLAIFALLALAVANLRRGRSGRRLLAVRNNERAAAALGIDVTGAKLYAFTFAGFIAAASGVLTAFAQPVPQFSGYDPVSALSNLVNVVLGGIGYIFGSVVGGSLAPTGLPNTIINPWVSNISWWNTLLPLLTGVLLVIQLVLNPNGVIDVLTNKKRKRRPAWLTAPMQPLRDNGKRVSAAVVRAVPWMGASGSALSALQAEVERAGLQPRTRRSAQLTVRDVRVRFGTVTAVDGIGFTVASGEVLSIIGPNGAGKTTLMDAITGFVPAQGTISLDSRSIEGITAFRRARLGIARSFQSLELLEDMSVMDNLRCASEPQDLTSLLIDLFHPKRGAVTAATAAAISEFGLRDKLELLPTQLAYGDRRLVAIARAVASEPSVLLLDEPASGLSERERAEVARLITTMAREWNIAVLLIEHDVELVRRVSDRVIALDFGKQIAAGTPDEVLSDPAVVNAYLGASANANSLAGAESRSDPEPDTAMT